MSNNQVVNQTDNKAVVIGVLKEKKIEFKVSSKNGRQMAIGKLVLVCDTPLGKGEVEVKVMQFADKKDGTPNSLYKGLQTVQNEYVEGMTIKVEGSMEDGTYYSANKGDFVEKQEIKATFINRVEENIAHCCKLDIEGLITKITPVVETNELEVEIVAIGYEGIALPVKAIIPAHLVGAFQGRYTVGSTTSLFIAILRTVTTEEVQAEVGFGEGFGEVITKTITKKIIFGGGAIKYAGVAGAISEESVKQGLALREAKLEAKKDEAIKKQSGTGASMEGGFSGAPQGGFSTPQGAGAGFGAMPTGGFGVGFSGGFPQQ